MRNHNGPWGMARGGIYGVFACMLASGAAQAAIPASERQALVDLYTSTNGASWTTSTGWNGPVGTECSWYGVRCGVDHVVEISLHYNNLAGPLPAMLASLPGLLRLELDINQLSGSVPSFAANTALQTLNLRSNQLSGPIPSFAPNPALETLFLDNNHLSGPVPSFAANAALTTLELGPNGLSGPIPSFASNAALKHLDLSGCQLSGPIPSFAANTALEVLDLTSNQLSGPIPSFALNEALGTLGLGYNQLDGTIPSFGANPALVSLFLGNNQLGGVIPSFAANTALRWVFLSHNQLVGPIPSFASNTALELLILDDNQLTGSIPSFAANPSLAYLNLGANQLTGAVPSFAGNAALQILGLHSNQLSGPVHPSLGTLTNLVAGSLDLRWNALFSTDLTLVMFLNSKQVGGDWQSTQTIPVTGLSVSGVLATQATVNWTPIAYTEDSGNYQVFHSTVSGGPYTPFAGVTANKFATSLTVTALTPLVPHYFVVQTTTLPHANNQNTVVSGFSAEVATPVASIADVSVGEGDFGTAPATFTVILSPALATPVTIAYATSDGTATAGSDYVATSGTVTFAPGATTQTIDVPVIGDLIDEPNRTFTLTLSAPSGAGLADAVAQGTIVDDDPQPNLSVSDCAVVEGNAGSPPCFFAVTLSQLSAFPVSADLFTTSGTAVSGSDFVSGAFSVSFGPGQSGPTLLGVAVLGDTTVETDESFFLNVTNVVGAAVPNPQAVGTILDDDAPPLSGNELSHGSSQTADLALAPDVYRMYQAPFSSYEAVLDRVSGNAPALPVLQRIASDNATVLQNAIVSGPGGNHRLSWQNTTPGTIVGQTLRVGGTGCTPACGPGDLYRIRFYDTTYSLARFNNSATQVTVIAIQNPTDSAVSARALFWSPSGVLLLVHPLTLSPRSLALLNTASFSELDGRSGSITITSDAPYGALMGKAVALEPATGFSFDALMRPRPH